MTHQQETAAAPRSGSATSRALRILVADDEPTIRLVVSMVLRRRGHEVVLAEDAHEALRLALGQPFDAALVDARMPGSGVKLLEQLDELPALRGRTVLMTGDNGDDQIAATDPARPILAKPFDYDEMVRLIEQLAG